MEVEVDEEWVNELAEESLSLPLSMTSLPPPAPLEDELLVPLQ